MKLKKYFNYSSNAQLWRLLISNHHLLLVESRDTTTKEVFFSVYNLENSDVLLKNITLPEKIWIGVEAVYDDFIFFHKFVKPDLPMHKGIVAFSISQNKVIWENLDFTFLLVSQNKLIVQTSGFEETNYYSADINTGVMIEKLTLSFDDIDNKHKSFTDLYNYQLYNYPQKYNLGTIDVIEKVLLKYKNKGSLKFNVEYLEINDFYFGNFHIEKNGIIKNIFFAVDIKTNKIKLEMVINSNINAFVPESFFVYKNFLILLIEKKGLAVYKME
ncbi:MAG: DUF4905 domain-containing protein [bacterium]